MINQARDCIQAVSKSKQGCALLDLDFIAAFDLQVLSWVFAVLRAKCLVTLTMLNLEYLQWLSLL